MNTNSEIERNPFPGLRPFREDEEYLFFGRESQVDDMVDKLAANRFLAVVGGSGSGKSSLVNSGLRPALRAGLMTSAGTSWRMAQFRPGGDPMRAMARALAEDGVLFSGREESALPMEDVVDTTLRMSKIGLVDIYEQARLDKDVNLLVVVDQFEELFRYRQLGGDEEEDSFSVSEEATEFVNLLLAAASQTKRPIYIAITMRSDFLGDCAHFAGLAEAINAGQYLVPRMTRDERRAAIAGPIGVGSAVISPVLLTRLVNDVGDNPDQLSILQHALNRTWARWQYEGRAKGPLDLTHYEAIGTMAGALDRHAEKAFEELDERQQLISEKIFKALTDKATDARGVRRPTKMDELCALADASADGVTKVIDVFRKPSRSFLMPPAGEPLEPETVVDISHESLMRVWARLNEWADEEAQSAHIYRRLAETSVLHADGKAGLWRDPDLQVALGWKERNRPNEMWARRYHPEFASAMEFLKMSKSKRGRVRRAVMAVAASVIFLFMSVALVVAVNSSLEANASARKAIALRQQAVESAKRADKAGKDAIKQKKKAEYSASEALILKEKAEKARMDALESAKDQKKAASDARRQKEIAVSAQNRAVAAAKKLEEAKNRAQNSEELANFARDEANRAKEKADHLLYDSTISLAQRQINDGEIENAQDLLHAYLDSETKQFRGFEWYYFWGQVYMDKPLSDHDGEVHSVAFSPDGKTLATGSGDNTVKLWDLEKCGEGEKCTAVWTLEGHTDGLLSVAFDRDGKTLATGSRDDTVKLWDLEMCTEDSKEDQACKAMATLKGHPEEYVFSVAFSPDGKTLATGSADTTVKLWDVAKCKEDGKENKTCKPVATLEGHFVENKKAYVNSVAFSPDGKTLATGSLDKTVKLWDVEKCKEDNPCKAMATLKGHGEEVHSVAFSPDGKMLATGSLDRTVKLWDVGKCKEDEPCKEMATLEGHSDRVYTVAFSPNGKTLATGGYDRSVKIWNLEDCPEESFCTPMVTLEGYVKEVLSVAFAPDGKKLATGTRDDAVSLWDLTTGERSNLTTGAEVVATLKGHSSTVFSVAFDRGGKTLATGSRYGTVKLWDVATEKELATLKGHSSAVFSVAFDRDGKTLATGSGDRTVKLWDVATEKELATLKGHSSAMYSVAFDRDGMTLATGSGDGTVKLWDVATEKELATLKGHSSAVYSVAFDRDGKTLATGSGDRTVKLWDVATEKELATLKGHSSTVYSVAFDRDGKTLATGSGDRTVKLWDVATEKELATLKGHSSAVYSVAFDRDGKTLATGSGDRTVKLWDVATQKDVATLKGHAGSVRSVAFDRDGKTLATGGYDRSVKLWVAATEEAVAPVAAERKIKKAENLAAIGQIEEAITAFKQAQMWAPEIDLDPKKEGIQNDPKAAANHLAAFTKLEEGTALARNSKIEEAIAAFNLAQGLYPKIDLDPMKKGIQNDPKAAANHLAAFTKVSDGTALARRGEIEDAITAFNVAQGLYPEIDLDPRAPGIQKDPKTVAHQLAAPGKVREGSLLAVQGEIGKAIAAFKVAQGLYPEIDLDPRAPGIQKDPKTVAHQLAAPGKVREGSLLAIQGGIGKAIAAFESALELDPEIDLDPMKEGIQNDPKSLAGRLAAAGKVEKGRSLATRGEIDNAVTAFEQAQNLEPQVDLDDVKKGIQSDAEAVARYIAARAKVNEADISLNEDFVKALEAYARARKLDPTLEDDATFLNKVALANLEGHPLEALADSDKAYRLRIGSNERFEYQGTRAIAKALLEKTKEAIGDFQAVIESKLYDEEFNAKRQSWINSLRLGQNPFTPELIKTLSRGRVTTAKLTPDMVRLLEGGDKVTWEQQGMTWSLPKGWPKMSVSKTSFMYGSPASGFLICSISSLASSFPVDTSLKAYYELGVQKAKDGQYEKVQYTLFDGVTGVEFIESMPEDKGDPRRHQWIGYRTYKDRTQMVNVMLSTNGSKFNSRKELFNAILYSMTMANK